MYVFNTWSPCHLLPYDLGRMLWRAGGAADVVFTKQGFPFAQGRAQASAQTFLPSVGRGHWAAPTPALLPDAAPQGWMGG